MKFPIILSINGSLLCRYYPVDQDGSVLRLQYRLPAGLVCDHCLLRWNYVTGRSWGRTSNGSECVGCGHQEQFRACADVSVQSDPEQQTFFKRVGSEPGDKTTKPRYFVTRVEDAVRNTAAQGTGANAPNPAASSVVKVSLKYQKPAPDQTKPTQQEQTRDPSTSLDDLKPFFTLHDYFDANFSSTDPDNKSSTDLVQPVAATVPIQSVSIPVGTMQLDKVLIPKLETDQVPKIVVNTVSPISTPRPTTTTGRLPVIYAKPEKSLHTNNEGLGEHSNLIAVPAPVSNQLNLVKVVNPSSVNNRDQHSVVLSAQSSTTRTTTSEAITTTTVSTSQVPLAPSGTAHNPFVSNGERLDVSLAPVEEFYVKENLLLHDSKPTQDEPRPGFGSGSPVGLGMFLSIPVTFIFFFLGFLLYAAKSTGRPLAEVKKKDDFYEYPRIVTHGGSAPAVYQFVPYSEPVGTEQQAEYAVPDIVSTAMHPLKNSFDQNASNPEISVRKDGAEEEQTEERPEPEGQEGVETREGAEKRERAETMFKRNTPRRKSGIGRRWASEDWENDESFFSVLASRLARKQSRPEITEL